MKSVLLLHVRSQGEGVDFKKKTWWGVNVSSHVIVHFSRRVPLPSEGKKKQMKHWSSVEYAHYGKGLSGHRFYKKESSRFYHMYILWIVFLLFTFCFAQSLSTSSVKEFRHFTFVIFDSLCETMTKGVEGSPVFVSCNQFDSERSADIYADGVLVRNAYKIYGVGRNRCAILDGLHMTVKKGTM